MPKDKSNPSKVSLKLRQPYPNYFSPEKDDPEYLAKRAKNNEAIKRSREKARQKVDAHMEFNSL